MTGGRPPLSEYPDVLLAEAASMLRQVAQTVTVFTVIGPGEADLDRVAYVVERVGMRAGRRLRKAATILKGKR